MTTWTIAVAKGRQIAHHRTLSSLTVEQQRMILRIFWLDRYQRRALGFNRSTIGLRARLAKQFDVSPEVIKKLVGIKHNQYGYRRRVRFKSIALGSIQRHVKKRLRHRNIAVTLSNGKRASG